MKHDAYKRLINDLPILFSTTTPWITLLANLSGELKQRFPMFSWVGFYLYDGEKLILGPYQGLPACEEIAISKGVCGTAAVNRETLLVPDVHLFPGHIACDAGSLSEIVLPLVQNGRLLGVLDIDSHQLSAFDQVDKTNLETIVQFIVETIKIPAGISAF
jgi:GAF domain-containing protein